MDSPQDFMKYLDSCEKIDLFVLMSHNIMVYLTSLFLKLSYCYVYFMIFGLIGNIWTLFVLIKSQKSQCLALKDYMLAIILSDCLCVILIKGDMWIPFFESLLFNKREHKDIGCKISRFYFTNFL